MHTLGHRLQCASKCMEHTWKIDRHPSGAVAQQAWVLKHKWTRPDTRAHTQIHTWQQRWPTCARDWAKVTTNHDMNWLPFICIDHLSCREWYFSECDENTRKKTRLSNYIMSFFMQSKYLFAAGILPRLIFLMFHWVVCVETMRNSTK